MTTPTPLHATEIPAQRIDAAHRQATIITGVIGGSLVVYAALIEALRRVLPPAGDFDGFDMLRIALFAISGVLVFTSTVLKGVLLRNPPPDGEMRIARLRTAAIITAAFAEVPAILGVVLFVLGRTSSDFYILLVVSVYMLVRHFPRREQWDHYIRGTRAVR
ncbi:MAG TPA: hypothetical protein VFX92_00510 [Candidatus Krumholzibacteria bacterium]|nr:hypothetical protein [Candidatus Krumholzibacteria bacterium]